MRVCVVGGGLTGLVAALRLSGDNDVVVLERGDTPGGCLTSYHRNGYHVERFYHHLFPGDTHLLTLLKELGIDDRLEWLPGTTGYYVEGKIHHLTTPVEILRYPHLSLTDKARLALLTLRARGMETESLDRVPAAEFIRTRFGDSLYASFFEPLLRSKFGDRAGEVSAAWLISRIAIRSHRGAGGERLGYLKGGFHVLVDQLAAAAVREGCQIRLSTAAGRPERHNGRWRVNGEPCDTVLCTIPPGGTGEGGSAGVPYQGAACMTIGLDRDVAEGVYWLNMKDPAPYGAVVSHTNFVPVDRYGEHLVYLASYFNRSLPPGYGDTMLADFSRRFRVPPSAIHWHALAVEPRAGPVFVTGYRKRIPDYGGGGCYRAGMFSLPNYPERSMEGSVVAGIQVADRIRGESHP
ncbi:MAG: NAD(P)/FAD-dependent oxidoreductase [Methanomicrobiales archaeon]|nr:NAD(P)/FAD-dependent oxidoreductase [Methanomicrobiales archaeon]